MSKKITMSLSVASINKTIQTLKKIEDIVDKAKMEAIKEVMEGAYDEVISNTPFDTGETASSTTYEITNTKATLKQSGTHVAYNEFGTGPQGSSQPHPEPVEGWTYGANGWGFYQSNTASRYYGSHYTLGQPAHAQMYKGSQYIKNNISKIIKMKVSGALSKI